MRIEKLRDEKGKVVARLYRDKNDWIRAVVTVEARRLFTTFLPSKASIESTYFSSCDSVAREETKKYA